MADMRKKLMNVLLSGLLLFTLSFWCVLKPSDAMSESERRALAQRPALTVESLWSGRYMSAFEKYAADQFPLRDGFRRIRAFFAVRILQQKDVNGVYAGAGGYLSRREYPLSESSLENAVDRFQALYERYLDREGVNVYFSVIPDKNYFMAEESGALSMDYEALVLYLRERMENMEYIDIFPCLALEDYYKTDTHWRQERILPVAETLGEGMGVALTESWTQCTLPGDFHGVYAGQWALRTEGETIYYLTSPTLEQCSVYDYESGSEIPVYDREKGAGRDPYEMFLSGSKSVLKLTNPREKSGRKLILFRDSFGSSLAPLLAEGYSEIDILDIRYISSALLERFVEFENCDVLFLYSTLVLNNSVTLK